MNRVCNFHPFDSAASSYLPQYIPRYVFCCESNHEMKLSKKAVHQALACSPAFFVQFLVGIGWGWTAPTLKNLRSGVESDFVINEEEASWLGSISEAGRIVGPFITPLLLDNVGRKTTLSMVSIAYILCWAVTIVVRDVKILLGTRILFGIGNGITDVASSIYIAEVCSPNYRGFGGTGIIFTFFGGLIFAYFLSAYLSFMNAAIVYTTLSICAISSLYFGVEPPYFLVLKDKHELAKKNLAWLRASPHVEDEFEKIQKNVEEEKRKRESFKILFTNATNMRALIAAVGLNFLFSSVGFHTVTPYASLIFEPSEMFTSNQYTIMYGIGQFVASILSLVVIENVGRRPLIIYSFIVITCCDIVIFALLHLHGKDYNIAFYPWLLFLSIWLYGFMSSLMAPAVYVIMGEVLPLSVRAIGGSLAVAASSAGSFSTAILFWPITAHFGMETNFAIFAVVSMILIIFVYVAVPETRGKSLHEMHNKEPSSHENA